MQTVGLKPFWEALLRYSASRGREPARLGPRDPAGGDLRVLCKPGAFRLDGAPGYPGLGERSFAGHSPVLSLTLAGDEWRLVWPERRLRVALAFDAADPFAPLRRVSAILNREDDPPFAAGIVGAISYELGERLLGLVPRPGPGPLAEFHVHERITCHEVRPERVMAPGEERALSPPRVLDESLPREPYLRALARLKTYIAAGDIYQANLTRMLRISLPIAPLDFYARLRAAHPAPFSAYLAALDGSVILGISPELFLRVEGRHARTQPIKGTRPRGATPADDARLRRELLASEKDAAELVMIVDLMRNDLGKVAAYGSVRVPELKRCDAHPTLYHLSGVVEATLAEGRSGWDLLAAAFPPGSVTGAPKRRAVEVLRELEPHARGVYTGAVGLVDFAGRMIFNVAIRTLRVAGGIGSLGVGGGIVADSDPEEEYRETLVKARAFLGPAESTDAAGESGGHAVVHRVS